MAASTSVPVTVLANVSSLDAEDSPSTSSAIPVSGLDSVEGEEFRIELNEDSSASSETEVDGAAIRENVGSDVAEVGESVPGESTENTANEAESSISSV